MRTRSLLYQATYARPLGHLQNAGRNLRLESRSGHFRACEIDSGRVGAGDTIVPRGSNALRKRLFEMSQTDPLRKRSAFALLGQIEAWRLEHERPEDEPRHPMIESEVPWPPLITT